MLLSLFFCGNLAGVQHKDLTGPPVERREWASLSCCEPSGAKRQTNRGTERDRWTEDGWYLSYLRAWSGRSRDISSTASGRFLSRRSGRWKWRDLERDGWWAGQVAMVTHISPILNTTSTLFHSENITVLNLVLNKGEAPPVGQLHTGSR